MYPSRYNGAAAESHARTELALCFLSTVATLRNANTKVTSNIGAAAVRNGWTDTLREHAKLWGDQAAAAT